MGGVIGGIAYARAGAREVLGTLEIFRVRACAGTRGGCWGNLF